MQFWIYLLKCGDGSYYAGHSDNLESRLAQHQQGACCDWTSRRLPVELVWCAVSPSREEAIAFERRIKGWTRAKKEALISGKWNEISRLARPPHERPSTSLRTNEVVNGEEALVSPERSAKPLVEGRSHHS